MISTNASKPENPSTLLDRMKYCADPLADATIAQILGTWHEPPDANEAARMLAAGPVDAGLTARWQPQWDKLAGVSRVFAQWSDNRSISDWQASDTDLPPEIGAVLQRYLSDGCSLPDWADQQKLERAEKLFMEYGALSVTMLFCSSLPECYVIPDLAAVLHATGQLEKHTEYRIRSTGAMIFPVMMHGGMTTPDGGGVAQILKVRLIHATIRNLILRGSTEAALAELPAAGTNWHGSDGTPTDAGIVPPLPGLAEPGNMHQTLFAHGWNTVAEGLPCNQEELAYTLLTFSYVFLRSMHKLGLPLAPDDEEAYLHSWNVAGHILGIERDLMANTMKEAEELFTCMQARGRADWQANPAPTDPRPSLGNALIQSMAQVIPLRVIKAFPMLLTRYLCGAASSRDLGLTGPVWWVSRILFAGCMYFMRAIDWLVRLVFPDFSFVRLFTRVLGYHLISKLLMDQTRPLKLPDYLLNRVNSMINTWGTDPQAPKWVNSLEDRMTTKGGWQAPGR